MEDIKYISSSILIDFINNNMNAIKRLSKSIGKQYWDDLMQETILMVYSMDKCPKKLLDNNEEIFYIMGIMRNIFYNKSFKNKFIKNTIIDRELLNIEEDNYKIKDIDLYEKLYDLLVDMNANGEIENYDFKVFLLYYFPEYSIHHINLTQEKYLSINKNNTYRNIGNILDINYQSIRWTTLSVMKKLKKKIK